MTSSCNLLADAFERVRGSVHRVVDGLTLEQLTARVGPDANTIAWLIWHLTRIQDDHIADVAGREQVWIAAGFAERFALPFGKEATGYGQTADEVGAVRAPPNCSSRTPTRCTNKRGVTSRNCTMTTSIASSIRRGIRR